MFEQIPFGGGVSVGLIPQDLSGGAKNTAYANVRNVNSKLAIVAMIAAGTATQDITITLRQAKDAAGTGAKVLNVKEVYFKRGAPQFVAASAEAQDKFALSPSASREAPTASYVSTVDRVATTNAFVAALMVNPADLDQANGFSYVRAEFSSPAAAQLASVFFMPLEPAYEGKNARSILT